MTSYRLHYFPESGNSYKLALMLTLCGQSFEPVWTDFAGGATFSPDWRAAVNAMGEIPVLEADGTKLTQTAPILLGLAERYGRYGGGNAQERYEVLRWLFWDNHKLSGYMATYRYLRAFTPSPNESVLRFYRRRLDDVLGVLENHLLERRYVVGDRLTIADMSMIAYLSFPAEEAGYEFGVSHPSIRAWLDRVASEVGWRAPYDLLPGQRLPRYR